MGYYTNYKLEISDKFKTEEIAEAFEDIAGFSMYSMLNQYDEEMKWYAYEDHMKKLSKKFPDVVFALHGDGEEQGDIWVAYFKKGKMLRGHAKVVIPTFEELYEENGNSW